MPPPVRIYIPWLVPVKVRKCSDRTVFVRDHPADILGNEISVELVKILVQESH